MITIKTITIVGANGTIGAQVSGLLAAFGDAKVFLVCRTYDKACSAIDKAVKSVRADSIRDRLIPVTYEDLESCVSISDWVFESVIESFEVKFSVNKRINCACGLNTIISTGTSGLSIEELSKAFDSEKQKHYFGIHFFNPPYSLPLVEFVRTKKSDSDLAFDLKEYLTKRIYRKVVEVKDKAAFLGNRIGFLFLNEVLQYSQIYRERGGIDYIDAILGTYTGRSMAPLKTIDFVGLDVHSAIIDNLNEHEPNFFRKEQVVPDFFRKLINSKFVGQKVGRGLFHTEIISGKKTLLVYDIFSDSYREITNYQFDFVVKASEFLKDGKYEEAINIIIKDSSEEASICRYFIIKYILLSIYSVEEVAGDFFDADVVMTAGFNWAPPSAFFQLLGFGKGIKKIIKNDCRLCELFTNEEIQKIENIIISSNNDLIDYRPFFKANK